MMEPKAEPAIEFRAVSCEFKIPSEGRITSLKEWAIRRIAGHQGRHRVLRPLEGVSFQLPPGGALGVIGRNGAGKSTLLRIAAGILQPSQGIAVVRGKVAPVIELGLGFEHELTGRENIFFNGAIHGHSRREMMERVDSIVEFAELEEVIDRPIRTYSTGMVARLAFAVATTVEAQVLLLDEVLSVGDESFKARCAERIRSFQDAGVTIIFVSHDLDAVRTICDQALWIDEGRVRAHGSVGEVIESYRSSVASSGDAGVA